MGKLSDILRQNGNLGELQNAWDATAAAGDYDTLPAGNYVADIISGDAIESMTNKTPGYRLTFEIVDGEHAGRKFWHEVWLTAKAMARTKRDLTRLGITSLEQLEKPLPAVFRCNVRLAERSTDDGDKHNRVKRYEVIEIIAHKPDDFAPASE